MSALVEAVITRAVSILDASRDRLASCAQHRISCEGWFKVELVHGLTAMLQGNATVRPEFEYVDIVVEPHDPNGGRVLVQLKTFPTNYGGAGKPITNFISGVVSDLGKLRTKRRPQDSGLAVWLAYPIPSPVPGPWPRHVERAKAAAASVLHEGAHALGGGASAHLYVMRSH